MRDVNKEEAKPAEDELMAFYLNYEGCKHWDNTERRRNSEKVLSEL